MITNLYRGQKEDEIIQTLLGSQRFSSRTLQLYRGVQDALRESLRFWISTYPNKRSIALVHGVSPHLDQIRPAVAKEGYGIVNVDVQELSDPGAVIQKLKKDTLVVLFCSDDPFFGKKFPLDDLKKELDSKKILFLEISYGDFFSDPICLWPWNYGMRVLSVDPSHTITVSGVRAKTDSRGWGIPFFSDEDETIFQLACQSKSEDRAHVESFEASPPSGSRAYFSAGALRIFDRAVFTWPDVDGAAITEWLDTDARAGGIREFFLNKRETTFSQFCRERPWDTVSLNRWNSFELENWFRSEKWPQELVRGTIMFDRHVLGDEMRALLETACREIREFQGIE